MDFLTEKQKAQSYERWQKENLTCNLHMNFAGVFQCSEPAEKIAQKLERISFRANPTISRETKHQLGIEETVASEEDFVEVTYRALSASLLADRPIDFSDEKMLKRGTKLLNGQTVFKDHYTSVDNWVGQVIATSWDDTTEGIPPGINALMKLDAVKDPMAVRGVLQGAIHSASVTVTFEWKPSHPEMMDNNTFWSNLGEEGPNGEMVRIIVTKIEKFWEISLVWQGADQYAKQLPAEDEDAAQQKAKEEQSATNFGVQSMTVTNPSKEDEMKLNLETLKKVLGKDLTEENLEEKLTAHLAALQIEADKKLAERQTELEASEAKVEELKKNLEEAETKIKATKDDAELGKKYLADEREEAIRLCKLAKGESVSPAILKSLETSGLEVVMAFKDEFQKECDEKFPTSCQKCGSTDVSKQSSKTLEVKEEKEVPTVIGKETAARLRSIHS